MSRGVISSRFPPSLVEGIEAQGDQALIQGQCQLDAKGTRSRHWATEDKALSVVI